MVFAGSSGWSRLNCNMAEKSDGKHNCKFQMCYGLEWTKHDRISVIYFFAAEARKNPTINEERLHALCILTYSDNQELQRSAALCFAEISDRSKYSVYSQT